MTECSGCCGVIEKYGCAPTVDNPLTSDSFLLQIDTDNGNSLNYINLTTGISSANPPAGFSLNCANATVSNQLTLKSGGYSIAEGIHALLLGPDGTIFTNPGNLRSITIKARKGTNTDAIVGSGNQLIINTTLSKFVLFPNDGGVTYSVEDRNIQDFVNVECIGDSAALIIINTL